MKPGSVLAFYSCASRLPVIEQWPRPVQWRSFYPFGPCGSCRSSRRTCTTSWTVCTACKSHPSSRPSWQLFTSCPRRSLSQVQTNTVVKISFYSEHFVASANADANADTDVNMINGIQFESLENLAQHVSRQKVQEWERRFFILKNHKLFQYPFNILLTWRCWFT